MDKRIMGICELADFLGVSKNTIYSWVWQKKIPYTKLGRLVKFDLKAIERWMEKSTVGVPEL